LRFLVCWLLADASNSIAEYEIPAWCYCQVGIFC
jgi:hypothetical protein